MSHSHCNCLSCIIDRVLEDPTFLNDLRPTPPTPLDHLSGEHTDRPDFPIRLSLQGPGLRLLSVNGVPILRTDSPELASTVLSAIQLSLTLYKRHLQRTHQLIPPAREGSAAGPVRPAALAHPRSHPPHSH